MALSFVSIKSATFSVCKISWLKYNGWWSIPFILNKRSLDTNVAQHWHTGWVHTRAKVYWKWASPLSALTLLSMYLKNKRSHSHVSILLESSFAVNHRSLIAHVKAASLPCSRLSDDWKVLAGESWGERTKLRTRCFVSCFFFFFFEPESMSYTANVSLLLSEIFRVRNRRNFTLYFTQAFCQHHVVRNRPRVWAWFRPQNRFGLLLARRVLHPLWKIHFPNTLFATPSDTVIQLKLDILRKVPFLWMVKCNLKCGLPHTYERTSVLLKCARYHSNQVGSKYGRECSYFCMVHTQSALETYVLWSSSVNSPTKLSTCCFFKVKENSY